MQSPSFHVSKFHLFFINTFLPIYFPPVVFACISSFLSLSLFSLVPTSPIYNFLLFPIQTSFRIPLPYFIFLCFFLPFCLSRVLLSIFPLFLSTYFLHIPCTFTFPQCPLSLFRLCHLFFFLFLVSSFVPLSVVFGHSDVKNPFRTLLATMRFVFHPQLFPKLSTGPFTPSPAEPFCFTFSPSLTLAFPILCHQLHT